MCIYTYIIKYRELYHESYVDLGPDKDRKDRKDQKKIVPPEFWKMPREIICTMQNWFLKYL